MTNLSSRAKGSFLVGVCFVAWLAYLAITSGTASRPQDRSESTLDILEDASKALDSMHARTGSYPTTRGRWVALPSEQTTHYSEHPEKFGELLLRAQAWEGDPVSAVVYMSDGKDYKLIWHAPDDCTGVHDSKPGLVDPVRTSYSRTMIPGGWTVSNELEETVAPLKNPMIKLDPKIVNPLFGECWAVGVWTQGAVFW
jgi:hypothetical protein